MMLQTLKVPSLQEMFDAIRAHHVETAGSLAENHEVGHSQWSSNGYKIFQHVLFAYLMQRKKKEAQNFRNSERKAG